jgi:dUTP pyrophosphatase
MSAVKLAVQVKKLDPEAILPKQAQESDAGYDLIALDDGEVDETFGYIQYRTGIAIAPPKGFHTEIFPRSSISKYDLVLANSIGLVDEGYRGEILVRFKCVDAILNDSTQYGRQLLKEEFSEIRAYKKGDKIAQLVIRKTINLDFVEVKELSETSRGEGGFGSTGT